MNTDNVIAAVNVAKAGGNLEVEHLTVSERWEVARQLGWAKTFSHAWLSEWAGGPAPAKAPAGPDYERAILARQESDESWWG